MRATITERIMRADAVADATLARRLTHAGLTIVATWLLVLALEGWGQAPGLDFALFVAAGAATAGALSFSLWAVSRGDRLVWRSALGNPAKEPTEDD